MKWDRSTVVKIILSFWVVLCIVLWITENTLLLVSQSNSLPYRYLLLVKNLSVKKGDLVAIQHHPAPAIENIILTKMLAGLPGDSITLKGRILHINKEWQGRLQKKRSNGLPLTPLAVSIIPDGWVFVAGSHENSFDSRYREFGLVEKRHILGKVYGLW